MAKPTGSVCNLDCTYCFYLEKEKLYPNRNKQWKMNDSTLELFIKQHIEAQPTQNIQFAWQGGEPTLMGVEFYRNVVQLVEKYRNGKAVSHQFQTNGILINDEWCEFFKQHNFLIGISIDGPKDLNDTYRKNQSNKGSHDKVIQGIEYLKKHDIEFNTLTVVSANNVNHPIEVYEYLKEIGSQFIQFIPLVERISNQSDSYPLTLAHPNDRQKLVTDWSVPSKQYGQFLNTIFDKWVQNDVGAIFVQSFDSLLSTWFGNPSDSCIFSKNCGHAFALEANGDLYQCDHYVYPEFRLGNIHHTTIEEMNSSKEAIEFGLSKSTTLSDDCKRCRYQFACHGGCPKHRFEMSSNNTQLQNYLCQGYFEFFQHTEKSMRTMVNLIKHGRPASEIMDITLL